MLQELTNELCLILLQAVVAISAAAPPTLSDSLKKKLDMASLAVATALQALSLIASDSQARHTSSAPALDLFVDMIAQLMQHVLQPQNMTPPATAVSTAEEVRMEELAIVACCCEAVASCDGGAQLPGLHGLPGEELLLNLLQRRESQYSVQVQLASHCMLHGNVC